jgi:hypothetical protein
VMRLEHPGRRPLATGVRVWQPASLAHRAQGPWRVPR